MRPLLWCHHPATANLIQPSSCCCPRPAILLLLSSHCHQNFIVAYKIVRNKNMTKLSLFQICCKERKTYMVSDKNKHFRKFKKHHTTVLMSPFWYCHPDATILMPPSRCHHANSAVLMPRSYCHPPNVTLQIQLFPCCHPQTALLMTPSPHCHQNFIVA